MKKQSAWRWVFDRLRGDRRHIVMLAVLSGLSACSGVVFALLSRQVLDVATGDVAGNLWLCCGGLAVTLVLQIGLDVLGSHMNAWVTGRVEMRLRDELFGVLFGKCWPDVKGYHSGELLNRITGDTQVVVNGVISLLPRSVSLVTRLVACAAVLVVMDWRFSLVMAVLGGLVLVFSRFYGRRMKQLHKNTQEAEGKSRAYMQESLENWMVIQSFDGSGPVRRQLGERLQTHFRHVMRRSRWSCVSSSLMRFFFSGSYYVALAWGALRLAAGAITFGALTAFLQIVSQIRMPLMNMSGLLPQFYNMLASAERLMELNDLPDEPRTAQPPERDALYESLQALRFTGVRFAYDAEHPVLEGVDLMVHKGEFVALAGFSGIGKSTLFKLLLGFYHPNEGRVEAVTATDAVALGADTRRLFAYVPQQNMLLSGTVRENIARFTANATEEAIWQAAETADVAAAIRELPDGLDTVLGERGSGMSEGQLQRLAIARAVLSGAPVLLLDEVTASLDEQTEARVLQNLRALPGRTCLCISHRQAAMDICDRVIRIVDGKCVEN